MKFTKLVLSFFMVFMFFQFEPIQASEVNSEIMSGTPILGEHFNVNETHTYAFTNPTDGEVHILLDETTSGYSMYLYDEHDNKIDGDYSSSRGNKIVLYKILTAGSYYIKVTPYAWNGISSGKYRLKAVYGAAINRDAKTFEPNDTIGTSHPIKSGVFYQSSSDSNMDQDVYQFTSTRDGNVRITLDNTSAGYSMYLYDENGSKLGGDYYSSGGNKIVIDNKVVKGTYYIKINPYGWKGISAGSYKLKATYATDIKHSQSTFEPNDTVETSFPLASGVPSRSSSDSSVDLDVYRFTTTKDGEIRVELDQTSAGYSMYLYNSDGDNIGGDYYNSSGNNIVIYLKASPGTYYVKVSPYGWSGVTSGTYRIKATYAGSYKRDPKTLEPNNTVETSHQLASGIALKSTSDSNIDLDVYTFTTSRDGEVQITLNKTTAGYSMYLYDIYGNKIGGDYYSSSGNTITITTRLTKGTYYIKVLPYGWNGISSGSYQVKASFPVNRLIGINGKIQKVNHQLVNNTYIVPAKEVAVKLGAKVRVDTKKKVMTITKGKNKMVITSGNSTILVNGKKVKSAVKPLLKNNNFVIPASIFKDAFGAKVSFDSAKHLLNFELKN